MIRKSRVIAPAVALLVAVAPMVLFQSGAEAATASSTTNESTIELSDFSSQIETLGVEKYPGSFSEADLTSAGVTDVYVSGPSNESMINAFKALDTAGYPLQFLDGKLSYSQLDALNQQVGADSAQLSAEGVALAESYPDGKSGEGASF